MGGGGSSFFPSKVDAMRSLIDQQRKLDQQRLDTAVNELLQDLLAAFNNRDVDKVNVLLDGLTDALSSEFDIERLVLGGSVAKHTYVDGLSDIDALLVIKSADLRGKSPAAAIAHMCRLLDAALSRQSVKSVEPGNMAVTVTTQDGMQIQLLPAMRLRSQVVIPTEQGKSWRAVNPVSFRKSLSDANERMGMSLVPTIKLLKALNDNLPAHQQLRSYHIEALCIETTMDYDGPRTFKDILLHVITASSSRVLSPIKDITGQSAHVDDYLGKANSTARAAAASALTLLGRRLASFSTPDDWASAFDAE